MRPQHRQGGAPQSGAQPAAPLLSVIDFGEGGGVSAVGRVTSQGSIESGLHHRAGAGPPGTTPAGLPGAPTATGGYGATGTGGGVGGAVGGSGSAGGVSGDAGLSFYAAGASGVGAVEANGESSGGGGVGPTGRIASAGPAVGKPLGRAFSSTGAFLGEGVDDEPPILEELGINLSHIYAKTLSVLAPRKTKLSPEFLQDTDLAGPLFFALVLGLLLLLKGKVSFGYIYGCGAVGCMGMYTVLNLMSPKGIDIYRTVSVLGYCLLPIVVLAALSVAIDLRGAAGYVLMPLAVLWCTNAAALFFVVQLGLDDQRWLVAYPVMLFYACFALISVF